MNGSRPSKVDGLIDDEFEFFVVEELIAGVEIGMHVIIRVETCPVILTNEVTGR